METILTKDKMAGIYNYILDIYPHKEECYVKLFSKSTGIQEFYNIQELKDKARLETIISNQDKNDLFISMNTFKSKTKTIISNLFALNMIAVDIDYKKTSYKNLSNVEIIKYLKEEHFGQTIPEPTYIEYSNQLRLIYILEDTLYLPLGKASGRILCDRISEYFAKQIKELGAEVQKSQKFIRIPFSINTKSNESVNLIKYCDYKYTLTELKDLWLDELPEWYDSWSKSNKQKHKKKFDIADFNKDRLSDFEKIQAYLNNANINDFRKRLCFLYHNYSLLVLKKDKTCSNPTEKAIEKMIEFNNKFKKPLNQNKIIGDTKFLKNKQYLYKNNTLVEFLELSDNICRELNLKTIYAIENRAVYLKSYYNKNKEIILNKQKNYYINHRDTIKEKYDSCKAKEQYKEKLKKQGKLSRAEENELLRAKIKDLLAEGLKQEYIAKYLNIGLSTLKRHIAYMKKHELLK